MKCIQCSSDGCGVSACRLTGVTRAEYLRAIDAANAYADAMTRRDAGARHQGRPDHDMTCSGMPLKPGT